MMPDIVDMKKYVHSIQVERISHFARFFKFTPNQYIKYTKHMLMRIPLGLVARDQ